MVGGDGWNEHNARFCHLRFTASTRGVCHGLGGYFETVLYVPEDKTKKPIELSINPNTMEAKSKDMISWFPIFFPLKTPITIPTGAEIEVSMWRQTDDRKVWYEWQVEVFASLNGTRQRVASSDLHSSIKNGCLM
ncbi:protein arginine N-methyltransferase HSL7, partial [Aureobasidium melanogenum]